MSGPVILRNFTDYEGKIVSKDAVFASPNKVAMTRSNLLRGENKYSGKSWSRWETQEIQGLRFNGKRVVHYSIMRRPSGVWINTPFNWGKMNPRLYKAGSEGDVGRRFIDEAKYNLGVGCVEDLYPGFSLLSTSSYDRVRVAGLPLIPFRESEQRPFVEAMFGRSRYRRDLLKAAIGSSVTSVALAKIMVQFMPIDYVVRFLNNEKPRFRPMHSVVGMKSLLANIDPRSYRHLAFDDDLDASRYIIDICRLGTDNVAGRFRSWRELHDSIVTNRRRIPRSTKQDIELFGPALELEGMEKSGLVIQPATNTDLMWEWGESMHNCIGSYGTRAVQKQGIYAGVYKSDKLIANVEIRNNRLLQLLGKFNQPVPPGDRQTIVSMLDSVGVDTTGNWWGQTALV